MRASAYMREAERFEAHQALDPEAAIEAGNDDMTTSQPSAGQNPGIAYARTREGFDLPVIDITNPHFTVPGDPAAVQRANDAFIAEERRRRYIPKFIMRIMLRALARKSRLVRSLFHSESGYLDSLSTYVLKLGADNLVPPYDSPIDRKVASSPHILLIRLRMQQVAHLLAEGLAEDLAAAGVAAPLHFINIGGGPALDSINALIVLRRARPALLYNRPIAIEVLDANADGAFFGANALAALKVDQGPLAGLDIAMRHHNYDWDQPALLEALVAKLVSAGAVIAASSEGALFEYGTDDAIVANLKALHAGGAGARLVVGSVTVGDDLRRRMIAQTRFKLYPRGVAGFAPLAAAAGFRIVKAEPALLSEQVLLRPL
jgi:hypothetical protein